MDRKSVAGLLALGMVLGGWSEAEAAPLVITFSGTVSSDTDPFGYFGGGYIKGQPFSDVITFANHGFGYVDPSEYSVTSSLTIGTYNFSFTAQGFAGLVNANGETSVFVSTYYTSLMGSNVQFNISRKFLLSNGIDPFLDQSYFSSINLTTSNLSDITGRFFSQTSGYDPVLKEIDFAVTTISGVPLPATLPMFGSALIALGAASYGLKRARAT